MKRLYTTLTMAALAATAVTAGVGAPATADHVRQLKINGTTVDVPAQYLKPGAKPFDSNLAAEMSVAQFREKKAAYAPADGVNTFEPSVTFVFDADTYRSDTFIFAFRTDKVEPIRAQGMAFGSMTMWIKPLNKGTYDIFGSFRRKSDGKTFYVCVEDVVVDADTEPIVLDVATATQKYAFRAVGPNGNPIEPPTYTATWNEEDEQYDIYYTPEGRGEAPMNLLIQTPLHKDYGYISSTIGDICKIKYPDGTIEDNEDHYVCYMTPSSHFSVGQVRTYYLDDKIVALSLSSRDAKPGQDYIVNDPKYFVKASENYVMTKIGEENPLRYTSDNAVMWDHDDLFSVFDSFFCERYSYPSQPSDYYFCSSPQTDNDKLSVGIYPTYAEMFKSEVNMRVCRAALMLPDVANMAVERPAPLNKIETLDGMNWYDINNPMNYGSVHPVFTYQHPEEAITLGNNARFLVTLSRNADPETPHVLPYITYGYSGAHGEVYGVDMYESSWKAYFNDQLVATGQAPSGLNSWADDWSEKTTERGVYRLEMNDVLYKIDGTRGSVKGFMQFDNSKDKISVPTLTHLRYVDAEGNISDRFNSLEGAKVQLSAADLDYFFDDESYESWYIFTKPLNVKFEVAPNKSSEYVEIALTEKAEHFYSPCYGAYFEGGLEGVVEESSNGWYDVRVTVSDANGNTQQQVIAPAFKAATTGVAGVNVDANAEIVNVFDLAGRAVSKNVESLPAGVYVVRMANGKTIKVAK